MPNDMTPTVHPVPAVKTILVVCTANVCRSPLTAALLLNRIVAEGKEGAVRVESAGIQAYEGREIDPMIVALLDELGIKPAHKRARSIVEDALRSADVILVMEEAHRQSLFFRYPNALPKIFLLGELGGRYDEVADPYGLTIGAYRETLSLVTELIEVSWPKLLPRLGLEKEPPPATAGGG